MNLVTPRPDFFHKHLTPGGEVPGSVEDLQELEESQERGIEPASISGKLLKISGCLKIPSQREIDRLIRDCYRNTSDD